MKLSSFHTCSNRRYSFKLLRVSSDYMMWWCIDLYIFDCVDFFISSLGSWCTHFQITHFIFSWHLDFQNWEVLRTQGKKKFFNFWLRRRRQQWWWWCLSYLRQWRKCDLILHNLSFSLNLRDNNASQQQHRQPYAPISCYLHYFTLTDEHKM